MGFSDVFAGFGEAAHEHYQNVLQMQYGMRKQAADYYSKLSEDPRYSPESQQAFIQKGMEILTGDPMKPLKPADLDMSKVMVQAPTKPPLNIGGTQGTSGQSVEMPQGTPGMEGSSMNSIPQAATAAINPRTIPLPPPAPHPANQVMSPTQVAQQQAPATVIGATAKAQGEANEIGIRKQAIDSLYPGMDPEVSAMLALKMPVAGLMGTTPVQDVPGNQIGLPKDAFGNPIDKSGTSVYTVLHNKLGEAVSAYPKDNPIVGGMRYAMDDATGHWVGYTTDRFGKVDVHKDLGLTPPVGVPTTSIDQGVRLVGQPDGSIAAVPVTTTETRTKGGVPSAPGQQPQQAAPAPQPPPVQGTGAGKQSPALSAPVPGVPQPTPPPTQQTPAAPQQAAQATGERTVGGKSLGPKETNDMQTRAGVLGTTIGRGANVLNSFDKIMGSPGTLTSFLARAKMQIVSNPHNENGFSLLVNNAAGLTPEESQFAADYASLGEDINVMRAITNATGFRGKEAFEVLQGQRGSLLGNPEVFKKTLQNSLRTIITQIGPMNQTLLRGGVQIPMSKDIFNGYSAVYGPDRKSIADALRKDKWIQ